MSSLLDGSNLRNRTRTTHYASSDLDLDLRCSFFGSASILPSAPLSSFCILGFFPRNAPPSFIPHPRNVAASESSISTSLAQEDSAFNRFATNPYNYPMPQIDIQIKVFQPSGTTNSNISKSDTFRRKRHGLQEIRHNSRKPDTPLGYRGLAVNAGTIGPLPSFLPPTFSPLRHHTMAGLEALLTRLPTRWSSFGMRHELTSGRKYYFACSNRSNSWKNHFGIQIPPDIDEDLCIHGELITEGRLESTSEESTSEPCSRIMGSGSGKKEREIPVPENDREPDRTNRAKTSYIKPSQTDVVHKYSLNFDSKNVEGIHGVIRLTQFDGGVEARALKYTKFLFQSPHGFLDSWVRFPLTATSLAGVSSIHCWLQHKTISDISVSRVFRTTVLIGAGAFGSERSSMWLKVLPRIVEPHQALGQSASQVAPAKRYYIWLVVARSGLLSFSLGDLKEGKIYAAAMVKRCNCPFGRGNYPHCNCSSKTSLPHTHPPPPATRVPTDVRLLYERAVRAYGISVATVNKVEQGESDFEAVHRVKEDKRVEGNLFRSVRVHYDCTCLEVGVKRQDERVELTFNLVQPSPDGGRWETGPSSGRRKGMQAQLELKKNPDKVRKSMPRRGTEAISPCNSFESTN
ncbi:hypothetical protein B0H14DRAFT_3665113 [Mycena olivaceomarginata]|nr:hypothetical protein B0H14DRAFT_3665113 [Mycena olivaceomarginata]